TFQILIDRHESLRTRFVFYDGEPRQTISTALPIELPETELSQLPEQEHEGEVLRITAEEADKRFDLSMAPLLRVRLLRLERDVQILVIVMHHIITDGWSMSVLFRELGPIYESIVAGSALELPSFVVRYCDYVQSQRDSVGGPAFERSLQYWTNKLGG